MIFRYGSYAHDDGECWVENPNPENIVSSDGLLIGVKVRLIIHGRKHAADPTALTAALQAMEAAYFIQGQDASLDGTVLAITSASTRNGVVVTQPPAYTGTTPGQYTTYVDYTIALEAEMIPQNPQPFFDYNEEITFSPPSFAGTNQGFVFRQPLEGLPQRQGGGVFTFQAHQSGEVSGNFWWLEPQIPAWPDHIHWEQSTVKYTTAKGATKGGFRYRTTWDYNFEAPVPLNMYPSLKLY